MIYPKNKRQITEIVLAELPDSAVNIWKELSVDDVIFRWWQTGRGGSGLRLSEQGMQAFAMAELDHYAFPLGYKKAAADWETFLRNLTKKLACPFYIGVHHNSDGLPYIRLYDHKIAMLVTLYGTIAEYLDSVK